MYITAMTVANTILNAAFEKGIPVNPMKLQRLLYLTYCGYAQATGRRLFTEPFYVWAYGPVCQSVYWKFSCFRSRPIDRLGKDAMGSAYAINLASDTQFRHVFSDVVELYLPLGAKDLCEITRVKGSAWYRAFQSGAETLSEFDIQTDCCWSAFRP